MAITKEQFLSGNDITHHGESVTTFSYFIQNNAGWLLIEGVLEAPILEIKEKSVKAELLLFGRRHPIHIPFKECEEEEAF